MATAPKTDARVRLSSGVEPAAVAVGEVVVAATAEFEFADAGGPRVEGSGDGGEGNVVGAAGGPQVGVVGHGAVAGEGGEDRPGYGVFARPIDPLWWSSL